MSLQYIFNQRREEAERKRIAEESNRCKASCEAADTISKSILEKHLNEGKQRVISGESGYQKSFTLDKLVPDGTPEECTKKADAKLREYFRNEPYVTRNERDYSDSLHDWDRPVPPHRITWTVNVRDLKK